MSPLVSVLIPCHNAERWIEQAISSALNQTYDNIEVIVVDDGSTDNSLEIIETFDDHIDWEASLNRGGNPTRNRLLELSNGEWLQYLDSDDYLLPNKISSQVEFLKYNLHTDIVFSPSILQHRNHIVESILKEREPDLFALPQVLNLESPDAIAQEILPIPEPHDPWILLARWYLPQTGSPLWRKQAIIDVGGWKEDQPCCQEHELYLRLLQSGKKFSYFEQPGSVYRQWGESTVCKANKIETYRRRLEVTDQIEQYLRETKQLSTPRQDAINQARFECARIIWLTDKHWAKAIIKQIRDRNIHFVPSKSCAPELYRLMYKLFGFNLTEKIAGMKRHLVAN